MHRFDIWNCRNSIFNRCSRNDVTKRRKRFSNFIKWTIFNQFYLNDAYERQSEVIDIVCTIETKKRKPSYIFRVVWEMQMNYTNVDDLEKFCMKNKWSHFADYRQAVCSNYNAQRLLRTQVIWRFNELNEFKFHLISSPLSFKCLHFSNSQWTNCRCRT